LWSTLPAFTYVSFRLSQLYEPAKYMGKNVKPGESAYLYKELFDRTEAGLAILRLENRDDLHSLRLLAVNPAACQAMDIAAEDCDGKLLADAAPRLFEMGIPEACAEAVRSGQAKDLGRIHVAGMGISNAIFAVKAHPLPDDCVAAIFEKVSDHKRDNEALQDYATIAEAAQAMIAVVDRNYRYLRTNGTFLKYHGLGREKVVGRSAKEALGEEVFERDIRKNLEACFQGEAVIYEMRHTYPGLGERDLLVSYVPIIGPTGVERAASVIHDITEFKRAEKALKESEARFRAIFENAGIGIALVDMRGHPVESNPALQKMLGYSKAELASMPFTEYTHPDNAQANWDLFTEMVEGKRDHYQLEKRFCRKDGEVIWGQLTASLVRSQSGEPQYAVGMVEDISERKQAEEALRELSGQLLRMQDEERRRIARELHDTTAQNLAALAMNLSVVKDSAPVLSPRAISSFQECLDLAEQCSREVRTLSYLLHPPLLEEVGLGSALRWFVEGYAQRTGLQVNLEMPLEFTRLHSDIELALYRIVQEGLTNIHHHSGSKKARVALKCCPDQAVLTIVDEGHGIPHGIAQREGSDGARLGVGIPGMRERIRQLGGRFEIFSGNNGTTLKATVPLRKGRR
jgi:PAS domain S-box-containing protein